MQVVFVQLVTSFHIYFYWTGCPELRQSFICLSTCVRGSL